MAFNDIYRANLDGTDLEDVYLNRGASGPAFGVDAIAQRLYFSTSDAGGILRTSYDGQDEELAFSFPVGTDAVAVDSVNQHVYWAQSGADNVLWRDDLGGGERQFLALATSQISAIQVDPTAGYYYWSEALSGNIYRTKIDTPHTETINYGPALGLNASVNDLALDPASGRLYALESSLGDGVSAIVGLGGDGSDPQILLSGEGVVAPFAIAVDAVGGRVYWSNRSRVIPGLVDRLDDFPPEIREMIPDYSFTPTEYDFYIMSAKLDGSDMRKEFVPRIYSSPGQSALLDLPRDLAIVHVPIPEPSGVALVAIAGLIFGARGRARRRNRLQLRKS